MQENRIEALAREISREKEAKLEELKSIEIEAASIREQQRSIYSSQLRRISLILNHFKTNAPSRLNIDIQEGEDSIVVCLSTHSKYLRKPFRIYKIWPIILNNEVTPLFHMALMESLIPEVNDSHDAIAKIIERDAAELVSNNYKHNFYFPTWYESVCGTFATLLVLLTIGFWIILTFIEGWVGLLLGWVPLLILIYARHYAPVIFISVLIIFIFI
jgi:hypothetical protein